MAKTDQYADIDFEEINDQTGLANDEIKCLKVNKKIYIYKEGRFCCYLLGKQQKHQVILNVLIAYTATLCGNTK